jgi:HlyD family secretion protein
VSQIAADLTTDQRTGAIHYTVRIVIPAAERARLRGVKLVPGMPVEAFVRNQPRTALSYLAKPLADQVARAFRED